LLLRHFQYRVDHSVMYLRHVFFMFAWMFCACGVAQDAILYGAWQLQGPHSWQRLQLNNDVTYQHSVKTANSQRAEVGRWHSAGVDAIMLTLYYDGNAVENWQRQPGADSSTQTVVGAAIPHTAVAPSTYEPASSDMYAESKVVELITQIACEELRYPQRDLGKNELRYKALAQSLGFESGDPAKLQRTLRYYQSNTEFMRAHQQFIAENSMRCAMAKDQVSVAR